MLPYAAHRCCFDCKIIDIVMKTNYTVTLSVLMLIFIIAIIAIIGMFHIEYFKDQNTAINKKKDLFWTHELVHTNIFVIFLS